VTMDLTDCTNTKANVLSFGLSSSLSNYNDSYVMHIYFNNPDPNKLKIYISSGAATFGDTLTSKKLEIEFHKDRLVVNGNELTTVSTAYTNLINRLMEKNRPSPDEPNKIFAVGSAEGNNHSYATDYVITVENDAVDEHGEKIYIYEFD